MLCETYSRECEHVSLELLKLQDLPLGQRTETPREYDPNVLVTLSRLPQREGIGFDLRRLRCTGIDVWECYELTWLDETLKPQVAELTVTIPCSSDKTIESKSMKLYLGSIAYTEFRDVQHVKKTIQEDLEERLGCNLVIEIHDRFTLHEPVLEPSTVHLDDRDLGWPSGMDASFAYYEQPDPQLLANKNGSVGRANLVCDSFYCLCPVTGQPDQARIIISYEGFEPDFQRLHAYLVSYRSTGSFHETNIERIYKDLWEQLKPLRLEVRGRFHRRGGISINPVRGSLNESVRSEA